METVAADGTLLEPNGLAISAAIGIEGYPAVACRAGAECLVVWERSRNVYGARVLPDGSVPDGGGGIAITQESAEEILPSVATHGTDYLIVWQRGVSGTGIADVYARHVLQNGTLPSSAVAITTASDDQIDPTVASDGGNYLVAWADRGGGLLLEMYAARVSPYGSVLAPGLFPLGSSGHSGYPAAGFNGSNYLVTWFSAAFSEGLNVARVSPSGSVLGTAVLSGGEGRNFPAVAHAGGQALVVWEYDGTTDDVHGARMAADGTVLEPAGLLVSASHDGISNKQLQASVGYGGGHFLVVWDELRSSTNSQDIYGARVDPAGTVLDSSGILLSNNPFAQFDPAVAFDGANFLVVWEDFRGSYVTGWEIHGTRISPGGAVLDFFGLSLHSASGEQTNPSLAFDGSRLSISAAAYAQRAPAVIFDGQDFVVAWQDGRAQTHDDIYAARVQSDGTVADPAGIAVASTASNEQAPGLATDGAGRTLAVYHRHDLVAPYQNERARGRFLQRP